jgi:hypothetical protein
VKKAESSKDNFVTVACIGSKFEKKFPKNLVSIWEYGQPEPNPNGETGTLSVVGPYAAKELPNCPLIGVAAFLPRWHDAPAFDLSDKWGGGGSMKHTDFGLWGEQQYGDGFPVYNGGALWVECVNLKTLVRKINAPNSYPADEMVEEPMQCVKSEIKYTPKWRIQYDTASCWSHGCRLKLVVYIEKVSLETYPIDQNGSWEYPTYGYTGIFCKPSGSSEYSETKEFEITFNEGSFLNPVEFEIEPEKGYLKYVGDFYITDVYH